nr:uncharacterized protein LOC112031881 [Quercus suber]
MSKGQSGSYAKSDSGRSSWGSTWQERRQKGREDKEYEEQGQSGLGKGSFQMYQTMSGASGHNRIDKRDEELEWRDEELEHLRRLERDLELEVRGRCRGRDHEEQGEGSASVGGRYGVESHQSESYWHRNRSYANRYWELYNEISEGNEKIAVSTFRMGLLENFELRDSLTRRPPEDMRQLMRCIEKYKRFKDDRLQSKGKTPIVNHPQQSGFQSRPQKDLRIQEPGPPMGEVNVAFKEPVHRIMDRIKNELYFQWPNKMGLVKARYLKEFVVDPRNQEAEQGTRPRVNPLPPPLGVIEVIHASLRGTQVSKRRGVLVVLLAKSSAGEQPSKKKLKYTQEPIAFNDDDLKGTIQPHDDALVVTGRINGFIVKRVLIDQGSSAKVMYPDLFKRFGLKNEDLSKYDNPLMGFNGHMVIPEGKILLPVNMEGKEVMVTFIVVASFSPYTVILGRPWIHAMGVVSSTLHVKVKFYTEQGIDVVRGNQQVAKQCLVASVDRGIKQKDSTEETPL